MDVSEFVAAVIENVVADLVTRAGGSIASSRAQVAEVEALAQAAEEAADGLNEVERIDVQLGGERLRRVLGSGEFRELLRQTAAWTLAGDQELASASTLEVQTELLLVRVGRIEQDVAAKAAPRLLEAARRRVDIALQRMSSDGALGAHEARDVARHHAVMSELRNLQAAVSSLGETETDDLELYANWAREYCDLVLHRSRFLVPPDAAGRARPVPFAQLYVPPRLTGAVADVGLLGRRLHRDVVLGAPGAGKTTLGTALLRQVAEGQLGPDGSARIPLLVVLKDYSRFRAERSLLEHLEATIRTTYQSPPPPGALDYLLRHGQAVVVFDGLDEIVAHARRREIVEAVESLARKYATAPMIATSRVVGYSLAPLGPEWALSEIQGFAEPEIDAYVNAWMTTDPDPSDDLQSRAARLIASLEPIPDLARSPLMLALICSISLHGRREIPQNRPQVYEACADLLFRRWDREREIEIVLPFERHLRPTLDHLANAIIGQPEREDGLRRTEIVRLIVEYLHPQRFADRDDALDAAEAFCDFCTGRAWVFEDVAKTDDEPSYQFTHRTFLEYFDARYLARRAASPEAFAREMYPHIADAELDVVAQIAFQLLDDDREGAADALLGTLLDCAQAEERDTRWNVESFAARTMAFLVPSPATVGRVVDRVTRRTTAWLLEGRPLIGTSGSSDVIAELTRAGVETRPAVRDALEHWFVTALADREEKPAEALAAFGVIAHLDVIAGRPYAPARPPRELHEYWETQRGRLLAASSETLSTLAADDLRVALVCAMAGTAPPEAVAVFPPDDHLQARYLETTHAVELPTIAERLWTPSVAGSLGMPAAADDMHAQRRVDVLAAIGVGWSGAPLPWLRRRYPQLPGLPEDRASLLRTADAGLGALLMTLPERELGTFDRRASNDAMLRRWWGEDTDIDGWRARLSPTGAGFLARWEAHEISVNALPYQA